MVKRFFLLGLIGLMGVFLMIGCAQKEVEFSQSRLCDTPIVKLKIENITKVGDGVIGVEEFKKFLTQITQDTNCVTLVSSKDQSDYVVNIDYEVKLQNKSNDVVLTKESQEMLTAIVTLNLGNDQELRKEVGQSSISTKQRKVIGLGENATISQEDENNALKNSISVALKNFITSLLSSNQEEDSQEDSQSNAF